MKPFNHTKILTIAILAVCLLSIGFVGAASAEELSLSATPNPATTGGEVVFEFNLLDGYNTYTAEITQPVSKKANIPISSYTTKRFTHTFNDADTYTIMITARNSSVNATEPEKTATTQVRVNAASKTNITTVSISLDAPVKGGNAPTSVTASEDGVASSATISWTPAISGGKFSAGTKYNATITFSAKDDYQFTSATTVKNKGKTIENPVIDSAGKLKATISFDATESETQTEISEVNLTVTAPAKGATPENAATTTRGVDVKTTKWATSESFPEGTIIEKFVADTKYYVKITLENQTNFIFKSQNPTVNVNGKAIAADKVTKSGNTLTVVVTTFDKTAATTTAIPSVSANVTAPATGNKPATSATLGATTYEVDSITWYKDGSTTALNASTTFAGDTEYKVTIVLKSKTNYIFNNSIAKANAKINGNEPSDFSRDSDTKITMSYTFPATTKLAGPSITFTISPEKPKIPSNANTVTVTYSYTITGNPTSATLNFGEGSTIDLGKADANGKIEGTKTHDFSSLGSFTASITAKNVNDTTEKKIDFSIGQDVLAAIIEAGPLSGPAPLTVNLNDKSTGTVTSRTWNFGDGSVTSGEASTSHTYEKAGTYTIKLTVSDGRDTKTATKTITVTAAETDDKTDETKKKINATYEPFITVGGLDIPSPFDIISEFVRLFQSMFDFDNYHVFGNATDEKE